MSHHPSEVEVTVLMRAVAFTGFGLWFALRKRRFGGQLPLAAGLLLRGIGWFHELEWLGFTFHGGTTEHRDSGWLLFHMMVQRSSEACFGVALYQAARTPVWRRTARALTILYVLHRLYAVGAWLAARDVLSDQNPFRGGPQGDIGFAWGVADAQIWGLELLVLTLAMVRAQAAGRPAAAAWAVFPVLSPLFMLTGTMLGRAFADAAGFGPHHSWWADQPAWQGYILLRWAALGVALWAWSKGHWVPILIVAARFLLIIGPWRGTWDWWAIDPIAPAVLLYALFHPALYGDRPLPPWGAAVAAAALGPWLFLHTSANAVRVDASVPMGLSLAVFVAGVAVVGALAAFARLPYLRPLGEPPRVPTGFQAGDAMPAPTGWMRLEGRDERLHRDVALLQPPALARGRWRRLLRRLRTRWDHDLFDLIETPDARWIVVRAEAADDLVADLAAAPAGGWAGMARLTAWRRGTNDRHR